MKRHVGRPEILLDDDVIRELYLEHGNVRLVADILGVSHATIHRRLQRMVNAPKKVLKWVFV
jgi:DNA-directed RNA polymerase specialized sigma24 family protein